MIELFPCNKDHIKYIDESCGFVYPWFTKSFIDVLKTWDIKSWTIFEWGSGFSTLWFAKHCKKIISIENNIKWFESVESTLNKLDFKNAKVKFRQNNINANINDGGKNSPYVLSIDEDDTLYDCIIIDGKSRNDCMRQALRHIKPNGIIIMDNVNHTAIGTKSNQAIDLIQNFSYEHHSYGLQDSSLDNWNDYTWRTDYWKIRKDHDPTNTSRIDMLINATTKLINMKI